MQSRRRVLPLLAASLLTLLAGCASLSSTHPAGARHGAVSVLYAGSLETVMNRQIGPAFERATGDAFNGYPAGSKDLANEIKSGVRQGDVFISASPQVNAMLEGSANGGWVSWYTPFAATTLVLGYNPHSSFAAQLRRRPWYEVITQPGFHVGFTDPKLDPKGALTVAALDRAASEHHLPALARLASDESAVFPEQDLVGRLQAGQLDAGFFYTVESSAAGIPSVALGSPVERAQYTATVLNRAPNPAGADAFIEFLLGARGSALLRSAGLTVSSTPVGVGHVPAALAHVIGSRS